MRTSIAVVGLCTFLFLTPAFAQQRIITGRVTSEQGTPVAGASVTLKGTIARTSTNAQGNYSIRAAGGQTLQFTQIGFAMVERIVGVEDTVDVVLRRVAL